MTNWPGPPGRWLDPAGRSAEWRAEGAVLFLFDGPRPDSRRHVAPSAGYDFGLVGISRSVRVPSGEQVRVPLLFVSIDRSAEKSGELVEVTGSLRSELLKASPR